MISSNSPESWSIPLPAGAVTALHYAAAPAPEGAIVVAHGAGAGQLSGFMTATARALASSGFDAVTFNFPYSERQRRLPDRAPVLEECYTAVVHQIRRRLPSARRVLFIGGKSMGGRIATHIAAHDAALPIAGLVLFGYPLHPPGKPDQRRDAHLPAIRVPVLIVQGSRDTFGTPDEIRRAFATVAAPVTLHVIDGGDHSFKVGRAGTSRQASIDDEVRGTAAAWMRRVGGERGSGASIFRNG